MPLSAGDKLGPYEILSAIGAGGMGEVYKACDTRLVRTVAIKILPEHIANREDLRARFEREARAVASLNHPNICTLHDIGPGYMVMELIEGETLAARIEKGALPLDQALKFAIQIADALDRAHRAGVTHRDIKPQNIMLTRDGVKVLDFGLAKSAANKPGPAEATLTNVLTTEGSVIGTPQYMAPEQFEGKEADARSDIWAFGAVLYEMVTGHRAFQGKSYSSLVGAILSADPAPMSVKPITPAWLERLVRRCLAKDPENRWQSMRDLVLELGQPPETPVAKTRRPIWPWAFATACLIAAGLGWGAWVSGKATDPVYPVRFDILQPPNSTFHETHFLSVSPDGRAFAHAFTQPDSKRILSVRRLDSTQYAMLDGTDGAVTPFWSPDSRYIAYFAEGQLKKVDANGGTAQVIADTNGITGSWSRGGSILVGHANGPLDLIPAGGGAPAPLLKLDEARKEVGQINPHFLPDGRRFVYASLSRIPGQGGIYVSSLDSKTPKRLVDGESNAVFISPGFLLYGRASSLAAQRFDLRTLQTQGDPWIVADAVGRMGNSAPVYMFSASTNGVLVYRPSGATLSRVRSIERTGRPLGPIGDARAYQQFFLSPDEKHFAAQIIDSRTRSTFLWQLDLATGIMTRLTSKPSTESVWSPDGRELLYLTAVNQTRGIYRRLIGGGDETLIVRTPDGGNIYPVFFGKDGSFLYNDRYGKSVFLLPPGPDAKTRTLFSSEYSKDTFRVSPDGRWVSYGANESGRWEVYVASFPDFSGRRQISNAGGVQGYWRKDGKELFYLSLDGQILSVEVKAGEKIETSVPQVLFQTRILVSPTAEQFAVIDNGRRFLVLEPVEADVRPFHVVLNWQATAPR